MTKRDCLAAVWLVASALHALPVLSQTATPHSGTHTALPTAPVAPEITATTPSSGPRKPEPVPRSGLGFAAAITKACRVCEHDSGTCKAAAALCVANQDTLATAMSEAKAHADCSDPTSSCYESYWTRHGIDVRTLAGVGGPEMEDLNAQLGVSQDRSGAALLFAVVGGLQDFLEDRAKLEALTYTIDQLKGRLCSEHRHVLAATCELLDKPDLALDEATLVRLRRALIDDLAKLPLDLFDRLPEPKTPGEAGYRAFAHGAIETVSQAARTRVPLSALPGMWAANDKTAYEKYPALKIACSIQKDSAATGPAIRHMDGSCWALLLPELGSAVAALRANGTPVRLDAPEDIAKVVERAATTFCATYGPAAQQAGAACLLASTEDYKQVESDVVALTKASARFVELEQQAARLLNTMPASEVAIRMLPDVADAIDAWTAALAAIVPATDGAFARTGVVLHAASAATKRDYPQLIAVLAEAFEPGQPFEGAKLPDKVVRALGFAARLAAAKEPGDAKKVFEEEAAPLGTYKIKYDREDFTLAINAFVGTFAGYGYEYHGKHLAQRGMRVRPLSAPLGIDWTLASSKHHHFGFMAAVIDPFAVGTVDEDAKAEDLDWGALLTPGLFARWGIAGSPFTLMGGFTYQPLARSKATCDASGGNAACWKGALQVGASIAIDVPLLVLH